MLKDFFQSNLFKRMLLTTITVPVVFLTLFFPLKSHIFLVLIFGFVITYLGSFEINSLIFNKGIKVNRHFIPGVNLLIYIFAYIYANDEAVIEASKDRLINAYEILDNKSAAEDVIKFVVK